MEFPVIRPDEAHIDDFAVLQSCITRVAENAQICGAYILPTVFSDLVGKSVVDFAADACSIPTQLDFRERETEQYSVEDFAKNRLAFQKAAGNNPDLDRALRGGIADSFPRLRRHGAQVLRAHFTANVGPPNPKNADQISIGWHYDPFHQVAVVVCPNPFRLALARNKKASRSETFTQEFESGIVGIRGSGAFPVSKNSVWHLFENPSALMYRHSVVAGAVTRLFSFGV